jgi:hypothetical protein
VTCDSLGFSLPDVVAAAAAVVALGISIWANQTAQRTARGQIASAAEQAEMSARMLRIEEAREADRLRDSSRGELIAEFVGSGGETSLRIANTGRGPALVPELEVNGTEFFASGLNIFKTKPPPVIGIRGSFDLHWLVFDGMERHYLLRLSWKNENGTRGEWESTIEL